MSNSKVQALLSKAVDFSLEELIELNKAIVTLAKQRQRATAVVASSKFVPGQVIRFNKRGRGKHAGVHYVRINGFNRAGTLLVGYECDSKGKELPVKVKWTVTPNSATIHDIA